jgi:serine/threonine protein kinase
MTPASLEGRNIGKYRVLEPLGRGGMAQVYKAYHPQLDRYVAIKVLRSDLVEEAEFLARFRREARAVAALRHPNIIQVYDFDVQDDMYYMVMELLEGNTLKAYLNAYRTRGERLPLGEVVRILNDALVGLAYAHSENIIHRDLKPANIMLTKRGQAVLTDFGIAQIVGGTQYTVSGALMGTLSYMAPEQGRDGKCDVRSDIYSLGIVFFEMLTGTVPFDADTPLAILMKHINDPLPMPHKIDPSIPEPFERIVLKALAKDPDDRYQSAVEMTEALNLAAQEAGIETPATIALLEAGLKSTLQPGAVAVFSGVARQQIPDAGFAKGDTDVTTGKKSGQPGKSLNESIRSFKSFFTPPAELNEIQPQYVTQAVLGSVGAIVLANIIMLWAGGVFGWHLFAHTWPMELVVVGVLMVALMTSLANPWLLIPAGILLGNGLLFTFYATTSWWSGWVFLWPLEPLLVAASIVAPILIHRQGLRGRWIARRVGLILLSIAGITFAVVLILGIFLTI